MNEGLIMEYITIAEYAERAGVSKQTAYNRSKRDKYKGYFRKVKGVLMVDDSIFEVNDSIKIDSTIENGGSGANTDFSFNENSSRFSSIEKELIEMLKSQIAEQNKRIDDLFSMIAEKDRTIAQITASIQQLQHERNMLEAGQVIIGQTEEREQTPIEQSSSKKGIFSRLLKRK